MAYNRLIVIGSEEQLRQFINDGIVKNPSRKDKSEVLYEVAVDRLFDDFSEEDQTKALIEACCIMMDYEHDGILREGYEEPSQVWNFRCLKGANDCKCPSQSEGDDYMYSYIFCHTVPYIKTMPDDSLCIDMCLTADEYDMIYLFEAVTKKYAELNFIFVQYSILDEFLQIAVSKDGGYSYFEPKCRQDIPEDEFLNKFQVREKLSVF